MLSCRVRTCSILRLFTLTKSSVLLAYRTVGFSQAQDSMIRHMLMLIELYTILLISKLQWNSLTAGMLHFTTEKYEHE